MIVGVGTAATDASAEGPVRALSLEDAIAHARAHQPEMRAALSRLAAQRAEAEVPRADWLPVAGATVQLFGATANNTTGTYVGRGRVDIPRIGGTPSVRDGDLRPYASTIAAAGLNQEIFDFGRIAARSAAADALVDVEKQHSRATALSVVLAVEEAYFAALAARAITQVSEEAFERARAHRDLAKAGVDAGLRSPFDLTRAEAELARLDIGRVRARAGLLAAQVTLAAAVGDDDDALDAKDAPRTAPDLPELSVAIREAGARDPRIQATLAQLRAQEQRTRAIGAELRPDLSLTATLSGRAGGASANGNAPGGDGFLPRVPNWDVGLVFTWPLFDGVVRAREDASRATEQARRDEVAVARHEQAAQIRLAHGEVEVARTALPQLDRSAVASRANLEQAEARFRAGLGTSVELADAEALRTDAEIRVALGQFTLARARALFGRAVAEGI